MYLIIRLGSGAGSNLWYFKNIGLSVAVARHPHPSGAGEYDPETSTVTRCPSRKLWTVRTILSLRIFVLGFSPEDAEISQFSKLIGN